MMRHANGHPPLLTEQEKPMKTTLPLKVAAFTLAALCASLCAAAETAGGQGGSESASPAQDAGRSMVAMKVPNETLRTAVPNVDRTGPAMARPGAATASDRPAVSLYTGQVQVLDVPGVSRIAVGNGGVLKAQVIDGGQVVLIGQSTGSTTLRVWSGNGAQYAYEVSVRSNDSVRMARDIQDMLVNEPGLRVTPYDGHVLIEGDYTDPATSRKLEAISKMFPDGVVNVVPDHKVQAPVQIEKMVYLDVKVVEVRKDAMENLGLQWNSTAPGPTFSLKGSVVPSVPHSWSAAFGIVTNLTSMLNILENNGDSWTLAEPRVSCKSGGDAKFVVGGEIPIPVASALGQTTIVYKQYGVILEFHPVADDQGNVSSKIVAEVSQPDTQFTNQGFVAFRQNRTETQVSLRENETLVISGLLQNSGARSVTGIPGVSELPILGALFRSKSFQNERTELVVMVTPRPASPQSETSQQMARRSDEHYKAINSLISTKMAD
jgi:pilus assembly protein CpaC